MTDCNAASSVSLNNHLRAFGIHDQSGSMCQMPEPRQIKRLEQLSRPLNKGRPKKADVVAFYEFLASPRLASWGHSNKADAIRVTGEFVLQALEGERILDVGCNMGYLTSWYARQKPAAQVLGIDLSPSCIDSAKRQAVKLGITNLRYAVADGGRFAPEQLFDSIVDTQGMIDAQTDTQTLAKILSWLKPNGKLICVPALGTLTKFAAFLDALTPLPIQISTYNWLNFSAGADRGAYPAMVIRQGATEPGFFRDELIARYQVGLLDFRQQNQLERNCA